MDLRRTTALAAGALLLGTTLLSGCASISGRDPATNREYTPANGANNRDAEVDVLGAVVVSGQSGSGTFIATLVNSSPDEAISMDSLAGAGDDASLAASDFSPIEVPARGAVNLADGQGVTVTGDFEAGQFAEVQVGFSNGESVTLKVPVVTDTGSFEGLDTSAAAAPTTP
jgi:hypothetical protein